MAVKTRRYDMSNRGRQAAETRRRIAEAAARLFLERGYAATTIDVIAAEAGDGLRQHEDQASDPLGGHRGHRQRRCR